MGIVGVNVPSREYWRRPDVLQGHATKRRDKYAKDKSYAQRERARVRAAYAERTGKSVVNHARAALPKLVDEETYTCHALSMMLGRRQDYIRRLICKGLWPDPRTEAEKVAGTAPTFNGRTAKALFKVFADHLDTVSTYRGDHADTTTALFDAYRRTH